MRCIRFQGLRVRTVFLSRLLTVMSSQGISVMLLTMSVLGFGVWDLGSGVGVYGDRLRVGWPHGERRWPFEESTQSRISPSNFSIRRKDMLFTDISTRCLQGHTCNGTSRADLVVDRHDRVDGHDKKNGQDRIDGQD